MRTTGRHKAMIHSDEPNYETLLNQKLLAHGFLPEKGNSWVCTGKTEWADVYWDDDKPAANKPEEYARKENETKRFSYNIIDINTADTAAFISLPGIGSKLAARIVNFREKLGGFYSIAQVGETYGLPDSSFQKIRQYLKLENMSIRKVNINTATIDELKTHPYIKWSLANPIVAYRNEHGPFSKVEDIKKVMAVTDEIYNKVAPYLTVQ